MTSEFGRLSRKPYPREEANSVILWDKPIFKPEKRTYFCHDIPTGRKEKPRWNYPEEAPIVRSQPLTLISMKKHDELENEKNNHQEELDKKNMHGTERSESSRKSARPSSARFDSERKFSPKHSSRPASASVNRPKGVTGNGSGRDRPGAWTSDTFLQKGDWDETAKKSHRDTSQRSNSRHTNKPPRPLSASVPSLPLAETVLQEGSRKKDRPKSAVSSTFSSEYASSRPSSSGGQGGSRSSQRHKDAIKKSKFVAVKRCQDRTEPFRPSGIAEKDSMVIPSTKGKPLARVGGGFVDTRTGIAAGGNNISHMKSVPGRTRNTARMHFAIDELIQNLMNTQGTLEKQALKMEFTKSVRRFAKMSNERPGKY